MTVMSRADAKSSILRLISVLNDYKKYADTCSDEELYQFIDRLSDVWAKMPMGISDKHTFDTYMRNSL